MNRRILWLTMAFGAALSSAHAAQPSQALACLILPAKVADVGSQVIGVIERIEVERGDTVKKGQVIARLRADVERASNMVARSRAESEGDLRGAIAGRDLAQLKLDRAKTLAQQNFVSTQAVEQAKSEFDVANERVTFAREQLGTTTREASVAQAQVSQRVLRSPMDGVVIERYLNPGERIEEKPIVKIADISALRVEAVAPIGLFGSLRMGQEVNVQPDLPGSGARTARIAQIDKVLDPASNTFRVRLNMPNDDTSLPAGLRCRIDLGGKPAEPGPSPASFTGRSPPEPLASTKVLSAPAPLIADRR
ncbi:hypothetical protein BH11PSE8_BH11PSE8_11690 [soil metagenome]